jgi:hypothetical protein
MARAERVLAMAMKRAMASNNDNNNHKDHNDHNNHNINDDRDNNNNQDDSGNKDNGTNDNYDDEEDRDNNEDKDSALAAAGGIVGGGCISGGNRGGVGGCGFVGWQVVAVVGLAMVDGGGGTCGRRKPSRWCLKRLMGSGAMAKNAMDVQCKASAGGGWAVVALLVFVFVHCVCRWVPHVQKNAICLSVEVPKHFR